MALDCWLPIPIGSLANMCVLGMCSDKVVTKLLSVTPPCFDSLLSACFLSAHSCLLLVPFLSLSFGILRENKDPVVYSPPNPTPPPPPASATAPGT